MNRLKKTLALIQVSGYRAKLIEFGLRQFRLRHCEQPVHASFLFSLLLFLVSSWPYYALGRSNPTQTRTISPPSPAAYWAAS